MKRQKKKKKKQSLIPIIVKCPNCKEKIKDGHFVPPGFGDKGFFICEFKTGKLK